MITLKDIKVGDVLRYWYDSGALGMEINFARVVKVGAKKVKVRSQNGYESWKYLNWFNGKVSEEIVAELRADGVDI